LSKKFYRTWKGIHSFRSSEVGTGQITLTNHNWRRRKRRNSITGFINIAHCVVFRTALHFKNWICFRPRVKLRGVGGTYQVSPLERANLIPWLSSDRDLLFLTERTSGCQWFGLSLSNGPSSVHTYHLFTWGWKHIRFPKRCVIFEILNDGQSS
jgi:hypothetical protein